MYLSDYINRIDFYRNQKGYALLFWIITKHLGEAWKSGTPSIITQDLFDLNNQNLFHFNEKAYHKSIQDKKFIFWGLSNEPYLENRVIRRKPNMKTLFFDDLTLDTENQTIYYFDYNAKFADITNIITKLEEKRKAIDNFKLFIKNYYLLLLNDNSKFKQLIDNEKRILQQKRDRLRRKIIIKRDNIAATKQMIKSMFNHWGVKPKFQQFADREKDCTKIKIIENFFRYNVNKLLRIPSSSLKDKNQFKLELKQVLAQLNLSGTTFNNFGCMLESNDNIIYLICALYSIKHDTIIGFNFESLTDIIVFLTNIQPGYINILENACIVFNKMSSINIDWNFIHQKYQSTTCTIPYLIYVLFSEITFKQSNNYQ